MSDESEKKAPKSTRKTAPKAPKKATPKDAPKGTCSPDRNGRMPE